MSPLQSQRIEGLVKALELGPLVGDEDTGRTEPLIGRLRAVEAAVDAGLARVTVASWSAGFGNRDF